MTEIEYLKEVSEIKKRHKLELEKFAYEYGITKATKSIGDKVSDQRGTIIADKVSVGFSFGSKVPEPIYHGYVLTKAGKPRKDKKRLAISQRHL